MGARDDVKGDVARMLFYMAVRYEGDDGYPDLELNDKTGNGSALPRKTICPARME